MQPVPPVITSVIGPSGTIGAQVSVDVQMVRGSESVYQRAATGTTHVRTGRPALAPTSLNLTLIRGTDARWRLCTVTATQNPDTDALTTVL